MIIHKVRLPAAQQQQQARPAIPAAPAVQIAPPVVREPDYGRAAVAAQWHQPPLPVAAAVAVEVAPPYGLFCFCYSTSRLIRSPPSSREIAGHGEHFDRKASLTRSLRALGLAQLGNRLPGMTTPLMRHQVT